MIMCYVDGCDADSAARHRTPTRASPRHRTPTWASPRHGTPAWSGPRHGTPTWASPRHGGSAVGQPTPSNSDASCPTTSEARIAQAFRTVGHPCGQQAGSGIYKASAHGSLPPPNRRCILPPFYLLVELPPIATRLLYSYSQQRVGYARARGRCP